MRSPQELLDNAERVLHKALREYFAPANSAQAAEFYEVRIQAAIFHYDMCRDLSALFVLNPTDFALKLALRDIVHRLFEYDEVLSKRLTKRIMKLAMNRGRDDKGEEIRAKRLEIRDQLKKLRAWKEIRNQTSAHYGKDIARQVELISDLDKDEVMEVARAFLAFNLCINQFLRDVGRPGSA